MALRVVLTIGVFSLLRGGNAYATHDECKVGFNLAASAPAGVENGSVDWADFDGDFFPDVLITGQDEGGNPRTDVFRNDRGTFLFVSDGLPEVESGDAKWGDYDNDGDPDIAISGHNGTEPVTEIFRNDDGTFTSIGAGIPGVSNSSLAWADFDLDGDLDLAICGDDSTNTPISEIYRNDAGVFQAIGAGLFPVSFGNVTWSDYDSDGDPDLLLSGSNGVTIFTDVYRNDGGGIFVPINSAIKDFTFSSAAWADYDLDGDADVLVAGTISGSINPASEIYRNDGGGTFTLIDAGLTGVRDGSVAWGDYDGDGDPDILLTGTDGFFIFTEIYRNDGGGVFTPINSGVPDVWRSGVTWVDFDIDGDPDVSITGNNGGAPANLISDLYRNDGAWLFQDIMVGLPEVDRSSVAWADYDGDGDQDFALLGVTEGASAFTDIFRNDGLGVFTAIGAGLMPVVEGSLAWADVDFDGDPDLAVTGDAGTFNPFSEVYRNEGGGVFTAIGAGITGVRQSSIAWVDYDDDGDPDLAVTGDAGFGDEFSDIFRNDQSGGFTAIGAGLMNVRNGSVAWGDYNNDGDPDLLLTGSTGAGEFSDIYRNEGSDVFTAIGAGLTPVSFSSVAWADHDSDGTQDILLTGRAGSGDPVAEIYTNLGGGAFSSIFNILTPVKSSSVEWGDYDNDGDPDILLTGDMGTAEGFAAIYQNNGAGTFTELESGLPGVFQGSVASADHDGDGFLDILITGRVGANDFVTQIQQSRCTNALLVERQDFPIGADGWTGRKFAGNNSLGGSFAQSVDGLCMTVGAGGANGVEWRSPRGLFSIAQRTVYRVTLNMSTDQEMTGRIPTWDVTWSNIQDSLFLSFGGRRWFVDTEGGAQGIAPTGTEAFVIYVAPTPIDRPAWNGDGIFEGSGMGAFTPEAIPNMDVRLIVRVLDFDESLQASARSGTICVRRVQIEAVPLEVLRVGETLEYSVPISSTTHRAFRGSAAPDPLAMATFDDVNNTLRLQLPSAAQATVSPIVATLGPDDQSQPAFVNDLFVGTVRNPERRYPVPSVAGRSYVVHVWITAPESSDNPVDIIDMVHDAYTIEWGGSNFVTSGDEGVEGGMAQAGSPLFGPENLNGRPWMDFVYINNVTASLITGAQRWRPQVDFFNRPDIGIRNPKDETGTDPLLVSELNAFRID